MSETILTCLALLAVDGDTLRCDDTTMRMIGDGAPFVSGFDTPETYPHSACAHENHLGLAASLRMSELLQEDGLTVYDTGVLDRFDRPLVRVVRRDGSTIGQTLIEEGLAAVWTPDYRRAWCENR